jgi:hypothetical protein
MAGWVTNVRYPDDQTSWPMIRTTYESLLGALRMPFRIPELLKSFRHERLALKQADIRALELLTSNLNPVQLQSYCKLGHFHVVGGEAGARYRIRRGHQMNVDWLDDEGRPIAHLCFLPKGHIPFAGVMLAQKIALELNETRTVASANVVRAGSLPFEWWME